VRSSFYKLALCIISYAIITTFFKNYGSYKLTKQSSKITLSLSQLPRHGYNLSEASIVVGRKFALANTDVYDLTLIPGIGEKLALKINHFTTAKSNKALKISNLEDIKGIGKKKAKLIRSFAY
jgi:Holliday junction resolvasome RuvABC DNA-binding subunit